MSAEQWQPFPDIGYQLQHVPLKSRTKYYITDDGKSIHQSYVFPKVHVLKLIGKSGPAIGDCVTIPEYKGKSIYPFVINSIAADLFKLDYPQVFIIVNPQNASSIRGIEKAGYHLHAKIKARRFLMFYSQVSTKLF